MKSKGKGKSKDGKGKGKGKKGDKSKEQKPISKLEQFQGYCGYCERWRHTRADCRQRIADVKSKGGAAAASADNDADVAAVMEVDDEVMGTEDDETSTGWCFGVTSLCATVVSTGSLLPACKHYTSNTGKSYVKWLRYKQKLRYTAMRTSVRRTTASSQTTTGTTRTASSSQYTTSTPMTTLTSTIAWCTSCIESAHSAHCSTLDDDTAHLMAQVLSPFIVIHGHTHGAFSLTLSLPSFTFSFLPFSVFFLYPELFLELDNPIVMASLRYSAAEESEDTLKLLYLSHMASGSDEHLCTPKFAGLDSDRSGPQPPSNSRMCSRMICRSQVRRHYPCWLDRQEANMRWRQPPHSESLRCVTISCRWESWSERDLASHRVLMVAR